MTSFPGGVFSDGVAMKYIPALPLRLWPGGRNQRRNKLGLGPVLQLGECPASELPIKIKVFAATAQLFQGIKLPVEITKTLPDRVTRVLPLLHFVV